MTTRVYLYDPLNAGIFELDGVYSVETQRGRSRALDEINPGTARIRIHNQSGNFNPYFLSTTDYLLMETGDFLLLEDDGKIVLEGVGSGGGTYGIPRPGLAYIITDGAAADLTSVTGTAVYVGFSEDYNYEWRPGRYAEAEIICGDGMARLARNAFQEWTTTPSQSTGNRLDEIILRSEVDMSWMAINFFSGASVAAVVVDGTSTLQSDTVALGTNVLSYMQSVNRAEQGRLFVTRDNVLTFQGVASVVAGSAVVNFSDTATGQVAGQIPFSGLSVDFGAELLYTTVSVERVGGTVQTADDAVGQAAYGIRALTFSGMLLEDDGQCLDLAQYLLDHYSTPEAVVNEVVVSLEKLSTANRTTVCAMDIGDTVTLNWTPTPDFGAISQTLLVEGIRYMKDVDSRTEIRFQLSAAPSNDFFILDNDSDNYSGASILDNDSDNQANAGILGF